MALIIDDFNYDIEMKNETISQFRKNTRGIPDVEFYRIEAQRLRGEYVVDQLHRLIDRLKQFIKARVRNEAYC